MNINAKLYLRYGPLTLHIKTCTTGHKITERVKILIICVFAFNMNKLEVSG